MVSGSYVLKYSCNSTLHRERICLSLALRSHSYQRSSCRPSNSHSQGVRRYSLQNHAIRKCYLVPELMEKETGRQEMYRKQPSEQHPHSGSPRCEQVPDFRRNIPVQCVPQLFPHEPRTTSGK